MQSFWQNLSTETIGGIVGGGIVFILGSLLIRLRIFTIRFVSPTEHITPEQRGEHTAVRADVGTSVFGMCIKPRMGVELTAYGFAFFDRGKLPWLVGRRRSENAKITKMRFKNDYTRKWEDTPLNYYDNEGSYSDLPLLSLAGGRRAYYELEVQIASLPKPWEGVFRVLLFYERDGNPETKFIRTKFFVRPSDKRRPVRSVFKKVLKCEPAPSVPDKEGCQT